MLIEFMRERIACASLYYYNHHLKGKNCFLNKTSLYFTFVNYSGITLVNYEKYEIELGTFRLCSTTFVWQHSSDDF